MGRLEIWRSRARELKREVIALGLAQRDPRVPWAAKLLIGFVVAYALSPIDLIPDFIPVIGYLDDLVLVPLGIMLAIRMIPPEVMADCRAQAQELAMQKKANLVAAVVIVVIWLAVAGMLAVYILRWLHRV